jgi:hypothetical protein
VNIFNLKVNPLFHDWILIASFFPASKLFHEPDVVVSTCNSNTWETEAGGSQVPGSLCYIVKPCLKQRNNNKNKFLGF